MKAKRTIRAAHTALRDFVGARLHLPSHLCIVLQDYFDLRTLTREASTNAHHLQEAMSWLCRAQDATPDGGVSARYRFDQGWAPSYPETTGYIIPTFFDYARRVHRDEYRNRALRMADWLLGLQMENGAFPGHDVSHNPKPIVFNTGQIMLGLCHAYVETRRTQYLFAARRAADWLVAIQEPDGSWKKHTYLDSVHSYHTRVAWPLLLLWRFTGERRFRTTAIRNLDWALTNQKPNGWFENTGFSDNELPYLHTIAYTIRGLLGSHETLSETEPHDDHQKYFTAAVIAAEALMHRFEIRKFPYAQYDRKWQSRERYSCLTGDSQIAVVWMQIYRQNGDARFLNAALKMNDFVKSTQDPASRNPGIRGGIKGSQPVWGQYIRFSYPNWAAKFFADALMLEDECMQKLEQEPDNEPRAVMQATESSQSH